MGMYVRTDVQMTLEVCNYRYRGHKRCFVLLYLAFIAICCLIMVLSLQSGAKVFCHMQMSLRINHVRYLHSLPCIKQAIERCFLQKTMSLYCQ